MNVKVVKYALVLTIVFGMLAAFSPVMASEVPEEMIEIDWNSPRSVHDRIMGQGPVEVIPASLEGYGVKLAGKKGMLSGYTLPSGWRQAVGNVKKIVATNSGSLVHDPATALNAMIFKKMTGIHVEFIEMKDELIWPKTMSAAMAKSTDIDLFYVDRAMIDTSILAAAGWIFPVDELFPPDVQELYPDGVLMSMSAKDGHFYAAPLTLWGEYLFYRPSWLRTAGVRVPTTWQELITASKKLDDWVQANLEPGNSGMVCSIGDPDSVYRLWTMLNYSKDQKIVRNDKIVVDPDVWNVMTGFWVNGGAAPESIEYGWPDAPEVFAKGRAGFIIAGSVFMKNFGNPEYAGAIQGDWVVVPSPAWKGVGIRGRSLGEPDTWAINTFIAGENKAAAMLWIDFYRSYQAQFNELYVEGNESCMIPVYDHPAIKRDTEEPDVRAEAVAQHMGESFPPHTEEALEMVMEYLHKVVIGQMDRATALKELQSNIDEMQ
jgi:ABC-type glycerol-3-phosphate transport system substrate-binding protein